MALPPQVRTATFTATSVNAEARTVDVVWTTGAVVRRWSWTDGEIDEELVVSGNAVRMDRLQNGAPVLDSHNGYRLASVLGVVVDGSARIERGSGVATVRFSERQEVEPVWQDIVAGIIRNVSVGYRVHTFEVEKRDGQRPLYRATDWEPLEISVVAIGADPGAQVRGAQGPAAEPNECAVVRRDFSQGAKKMLNDLTEGTGNPTDASNPTDAGNATRASEIHAIMEFGRENAIDPGFVAELIARDIGLVAAKAEIIAVDVERERRAGRIISRDQPLVGHTFEQGPGLMEKLGDAFAHKVAVRAGMPYELTVGREFAGRGMTIDQMAGYARRQSGNSWMKSGGSQRSFHTDGDFSGIAAYGLNALVSKAYMRAEPAIAGAGSPVDVDDFRDRYSFGLSGSGVPQKAGEGDEIKGVTLDERGEKAAKPDAYASIFNITYVSHPLR